MRPQRPRKHAWPAGWLGTGQDRSTLHGPKAPFFYEFFTPTALFFTAPARGRFRMSGVDSSRGGCIDADICVAEYPD
jgi:hypothetical protein